MAWSRILRFARERRVPIVVTDDEGESPMVLVSLEELESILDGHDRTAPPPDLEPIMYPSVQKEEAQVPNFLETLDFTTQDTVVNEEAAESPIEPVSPFEYEEAPIEAPDVESIEGLAVPGNDDRREPLSGQTVSDPAAAIQPEGEPREKVAGEPREVSSVPEEALSLEEQFYLDHG